MFEPGVMFWAERDNLDMALSLGVRYGQLGIPGGMQLTDAVAADWKSALEAAGFTLVTVFAAYEGEDYTDIPAVARTVGFVPPDTRAARLARTLAVSDFAAQLGVSSIACHVGFVPEDAQHPDYVAVREVVRAHLRPCGGTRADLCARDRPGTRGGAAAIHPRRGPRQSAHQLRPGQPDSLWQRRTDRGAGDVGAAGDFGALQGRRLAGARSGGRFG